MAGLQSSEHERDSFAKGSQIGGRRMIGLASKVPLSCRTAFKIACYAPGFEHANPAGQSHLWRAKAISSRIETGRREARPMDFKDRRIWYAVAAVIVVLIIIGYATGWFSGAPAPTPQQ
jgi:hypothetical protein